MQKFIISTDSGCDLSAEECKKRGIETLMMSYAIDDTVYHDTMEVSALGKFYADMENGAIPKTGSVSIGESLEHFEKLAERGLPIIHLTLGSGISGTYSNALQAKELLLAKHPEVELHIVDTTLASTGYGLLAIEAAEMRDKGLSAEECVEVLEAEKWRVEPFYTTGDLKYLYRGGRVSRGGMIIAHALGIQPILDLSYEGKLRVCGKVRGQKQTWDRIAEIIKERSISPETQTLYISHSNAPELAHQFAEHIMSVVPFKDVFYTYIGTIIGAHTGPGLVAAFFKGKIRDEE